MRLTVLFLLILPNLVLALETGSSHNLFVVSKLNDDWSFVGRGNLVTRDGFSDTFFAYGDVNLRYRLDEHWSLEGGYRRASLKLSGGWRQEYRPMFSLYWKDQWDNWSFANRHRIELRTFEGNAQDRVRYRNESEWHSRHQYTDLKLRPYINEEYFYDVTNHRFNENWLNFGVSKKIARGISLKLGYRLQSQKFGDQWDDRHVLVTGISIINL